MTGVAACHLFLLSLLTCRILALHFTELIPRARVVYISHRGIFLEGRRRSQWPQEQELLLGGLQPVPKERVLLAKLLVLLAKLPSRLAVARSVLRPRVVLLSLRADRRRRRGLLVVVVLLLLVVIVVVATAVVVVVFAFDGSEIEALGPQPLVDVRGVDGRFAPVVETHAQAPRRELPLHGAGEPDDPVQAVPV